MKHKFPIYSFLIPGGRRIIAKFLISPPSIGWGLIREGGLIRGGAYKIILVLPGGLIRGGGLIEAGGLLEELRYQGCHRALKTLKTLKSLKF